MCYNLSNLERSLGSLRGNIPFDYCIIDNFFIENVAKDLEADFLNYEDHRWFYYKSSIENKKALNDWNIFPSLTYRVLRELNSEKFINVVANAAGVPLYHDPGLHGGGWHIHGQGGNLNPHQDYSIHPKIGLQRKLNLIIYLSSDLSDSHGGHLGLWSHNEDMNAPDELLKEVEPKFNRAIIFDTTQNSWHGMSRPLLQPPGIFRKSLAVYYLTDPVADTDPRERALFAPREEQKGDKVVQDLIKARADSKIFSSAYRVD